MRLKLYYPILGLALLLSISSKAQFENIDLNKYKLTDYKYKSLGINFDLSNATRYSDASNKTKENSFYSSDGINYSATNYSRKYIGNHYLGFGISLSNDFAKNDNTSYTSNSSRLTLAFRFITQNKFYFSNDFFYGVNFSSSQFPSHSYIKVDNTSGFTSSLLNDISSVNFVAFRVGKGRIENVTDARMAIYILDDLAKQGRLSRIPTETEVFQFADFITKTLNKRVIDSRIKIIKESIAVDSFLTTNGLSNKTDGLYFGLINDNWNFGRLQSWITGTNWYIGISPSLNYQNQFRRTNNYGSILKFRNELSEYSISFDAGYSSDKIIGLKWQKGYYVNCSFNIFKYDSVGNFTNIKDYKRIIVDSRYLLSYIPNTRTSISLGGGFTIMKYVSKDLYYQIQISPNISGYCNYYFSEKLRFTAGAGINYNFNKQYDPMITSKELNFGLTATLNYYIF